jgi:hypothetical protein
MGRGIVWRGGEGNCVEGRGIEWRVEGRGGHTDTELQPADTNSLYIKESQLRLTATFLRPKVI